MTDQPADLMAPPDLTDKEMEVLRGLCRGDKQELIASNMGVTVRWVEYLVSSIKQKFDAQTPTTAVVRAIQSGVVKPE